MPTQSPIPVFGLLHYNGREETTRCVLSIDRPTAHLVIVLTGDHDFEQEVRSLVALKPVAKLTIVKLENPGWAVSVNYILVNYPAPWWLITSNDMEFAPGDLALVEIPDRPCISLSNHGMGWFVINAPALEKVGLFDFNLCPCYFEDLDYLRRAVLSGVEIVDLPAHSKHGIDNKPSHTVNKSPALQRENARTFEGNKQYYISKWGGEPGKETYNYPFNHLDHPMWAVKFIPAMRAMQQWDL